MVSNNSTKFKKESGARMFQFNEMLNFSGPVIVILTALSVLTFSFYLERLFAIIAFDRKIREGLMILCSSLKRPETGINEKALIDDAFERLILKKEYINRVNIKNIALHYEVELNEIIENIRVSVVKIGSVASLAPYIGLFGTVVGIMNSFSEIARTGTSNFVYVSKGISEALIATAAGLLLAIMASFGYNHLAAKLRSVDNAKNSAMERIKIAIESCGQNG